MTEKQGPRRLTILVREALLPTLTQWATDEKRTPQAQAEWLVERALTDYREAQLGDCAVQWDSAETERKATG